MADKIGMLEFNGERLDLKDYDDMLKEFIPKGKDKTIFFQRTDYTPMRVLGGIKGVQTKTGGEFQMRTFDTVTMPIKQGASKLLPKDAKDFTEGVLVYYEGKSKRPGNDGVLSMGTTPDYLTWERGCMSFNGLNKAKLLFLLMHSENQRNQMSTGYNGVTVGWSQITPRFYIVIPAHASKGIVDLADLKFEAQTLIRNAQKDGQDKLKMMYEALGHSDWYNNLQLKSGSWQGDWTPILGALLGVADTNPQRIISYFNDTSLEISSKITFAMSTEILTYEAGLFLWGSKSSNAKGDVKTRMITKAPDGKQLAEDAKDWFAGWLKNNSDVLQAISAEISKAVVS